MQNKIALVDIAPHRIISSHREAINFFSPDVFANAQRIVKAKEAKSEEHARLKCYNVFLAYVSSLFSNKNLFPPVIFLTSYCVRQSNFIETAQSIYRIND